MIVDYLKTKMASESLSLEQLKDDFCNGNLVTTFLREQTEKFYNVDDLQDKSNARKVYGSC